MVAFSEQRDTLPALGVGVSLSFGMEPDPVALAGRPGGPGFVEYAGAVQLERTAREVGALRALGLPVLFHPSCLNLCGPWPNPPDWLEAVDAHVRGVDSAWLAQDVAVCFAGETPGYSIQLGYFVPPILTRASLEQAVERVAEVRAVVGAPLLLEPAPVTFSLGDMGALQWLGALAERADCGLLLDAGHVVSHLLAGGEPSLNRALEGLDLSRVIELHVAGGVLHRRGDRRYYLDAHELPVLPEVWRVFEALLQRCEHLRAVCVECEGPPESTVLPALERARRAVVERSSSPLLRVKVRAELAAAGGER